MTYIELAAKQTGAAVALRYLVQSLIEETGELGELQRVEERLAYAFADIDSLLAEEFSKEEEFRTLLADFVDGEEVDTLPLGGVGIQECSTVFVRFGGPAQKEMSAWRVAALAADDSQGFRQLAMADVPRRQGRRHEA